MMTGYFSVSLVCVYVCVGCSMNSTEAEGQILGQSEEDSELQDGVSWSAEVKPIFTEGLRRSRRQVSVHVGSLSLLLCSHTSKHTDGQSGPRWQKHFRLSPAEKHQRGEMPTQLIFYNYV